MSKRTKEPGGQSKRPYERPRLEPSQIFGAEAMVGSCCRRTTGTCSLAARNAGRTTIDPSKVRLSTTS
ncbi:MAG TPA: hypothetical protein VLT62_00385 [Candidatus Methylomirabilis sp.]|nr:hypothetical protein [Candidatus Methylomirabilis sp.]